MLQNWFKSCSKLLQKCCKLASDLSQQNWFKIASKLLQTCWPTLHQVCFEIASKLLRTCCKLASDLLQKCLKRSLRPSCQERASAAKRSEAERAERSGASPQNRKLASNLPQTCFKDSITRAWRWNPLALCFRFSSWSGFWGTCSPERTDFQSVL